MFIHVIKPGETLWQVANYYNVSIGAIVEINELPNPNQLIIGQALVIPTENIFHIVKQGESLWRIAQIYRTTISNIMQNNKNIKPDNIYPGMVLYIPAPRYTVQYGDTLWAIARKYGVSINDLLKVNKITNATIIYPGTVLVIPTKPRPVKEVNGYIYFLDEDAVPIVNKDGNHLTYLCPFAYLIREDGSLQPIKDVPAIQTAKSKKVQPMMSITNFSSTAKGENLAHVVLANPQIVELLLNNTINVMKEKGYVGLNIDFENVLPPDRELYNSFLELTVKRLHGEGFFVSTALAPKTSIGQVGLLYEAHDYEAHGRIVDFVVLMTYEWGWRKGPPQAISPLNRIKQVLDYAITVIPREKIFFGFQIYARDWLVPFVQGSEAETFSCQEAIIRAAKYGTEILYDQVAQSPYYRYKDEQGRRHEVWFEDARSAQAKFDTTRAYNLRGISYWALGYPFPQNWALLEDNFTVRKLL